MLVEAGGASWEDTEGWRAEGCRDGVLHTDSKAVRRKGWGGRVWGGGESPRSTRQSRQFEVKTEKRKRNLGEACVGLQSALQSQGRIEVMLKEQSQGSGGSHAPQVPGA